MAQFDVYVNPNPDSRAFVPYVVDVQSGLIDLLPTRLVIPLSRVGAGQPKLPVNLCPVLKIEGEALTLMPHLAAPVSARALKNPVHLAVQYASDIRAAMDAVFSGF